MSPIGVFCYNRPHHLQACLTAIERSFAFQGFSQPLYIFCDAAKNGENSAISRTQEVARAHPKATVIVRERNFGFANITSGITTLCDQFGSAIIIEDDVLISPDFLPFMNAGLQRYADDPRVFVISGFMYFNSQPRSPLTFFLPQQFIWGWGTWKRAWKYYESHPKDWQTQLQDRKFTRHFDCFHSIKFSKMLEKTMTGVWNTWDAQWMFCQAKQRGLTLFPYQSLVWNCGSGGGTHGDPNKDHDITLCDREHYIHGTLSHTDFEIPRLIKHPEDAKQLFPTSVAPDFRAMRYLADAFLQEWQRREPRLKWQMKRVINQMMRTFTPRPKG